MVYQAATFVLSLHVCIGEMWLRKGDFRVDTVFFLLFIPSPSGHPPTTRARSCTTVFFIYIHISLFWSYEQNGWVMIWAIGKIVENGMWKSRQTVTRRVPNGNNNYLRKNGFSLYLFFGVVIPQKPYNIMIWKCYVQQFCEKIKLKEKATDKIVSHCTYISETMCRSAAKVVREIHSANKLCGAW